jgi:hypothetical protein
MTFRKRLTSNYGFGYVLEVDFIPNFNTFDYLNVFHPGSFAGDKSAGA